MPWTETLPRDKRDKLAAALAEHGSEHVAYAGGDENYAGFLLAADVICRKQIGVSIFDLADYCWTDAYHDDMTPGDALRGALAADGF
ncbi:hypothetical protein [Actinoplanes sp. NPDC051411]|uniref:hypothetical protein n=1 Tax=Actinoplanes sp. NPDC051411 TaxID=3155522 RepID=UPI0034316768